MTLRIVSLVPSMTETLLARGVTPLACTRFCEQPTLTHVGGTTNPDIDAIVALHRDLVVVDAEQNRREDHDALAGPATTGWDGGSAPSAVDLAMATTPPDSRCRQEADCSQPTTRSRRRRYTENETLPIAAGVRATPAGYPLDRRS